MLAVILILAIIIIDRWRTWNPNMPHTIRWSQNWYMRTDLPIFSNIHQWEQMPNYTGYIGIPWPRRKKKITILEGAYLQHSQYHISQVCFYWRWVHIFNRTSETPIFIASQTEGASRVTDPKHVISQMGNWGSHWLGNWDTTKVNWEIC